MTDDNNPQSLTVHDPLPESNWFWRRVFIFVTTACILWFLWGAMDRLGAAAILKPEIGIVALLTLCKWITGFAALLATFYLAAPSAEQMLKAVQTAGMLRSGVVLTEPPRLDPPPHHDEHGDDHQRPAGMPDNAPWAHH